MSEAPSPLREALGRILEATVTAGITSTVQHAVEHAGALWRLPTDVAELQKRVEQLEQQRTQRRKAAQ